MSKLYFVYGMVLLLLLAACQGGAQVATLTPIASDTSTVQVQTFTPIPTVALSSATFTPSRTPAPTLTSTATASPTETPPPTATASASPRAALAAQVDDTLTPIHETVQSAAADSGLPLDHYWLQRPIAQDDDRTHWLDRTYPYGSTQSGQRDVHLGVEFVNQRFTPVLAAADGLVLFAGQDSKMQLGPGLDYYGNVVVIQHDFTATEGLPVYTLYAHLQDIAVEAGERIAAGERVGRVGDTGIAMGPHLHFEVRVGNPYDYRRTRNPDLWLQPYPHYGTLAGRIDDVDEPDSIVIELRGETFKREMYLYAGDRVNSDPAWNENFTLGDIPAGDYEVVVTNGMGRYLFREQVTIEAGKTSFVAIDLS